MARSTALIASSLLCISLLAQSMDRVVEPAGSGLNHMLACHLSDGGYLMCGTDLNNGNFKLVRLSANGTPLWGKQMPTSVLGQGIYSISTMGQLANGDLYFMANVYGMGMWAARVLARLDADGNIVWLRGLDFGSVVGDDYWLRSARVMETATGELMVNVPATQNPVIAKLTAAGDAIWAKSVTSTEDTVYNKHPTFDMVPTDDGGVIVCGKARDWPYVMRMDGNGAVISSRTYYAVTDYTHLRAMELLSNGDLLLAGMNDGAGMMMRLASDGSIQWQKQFNTTGFTGMEALGNDSFMLSTEYGDIVRVDADGNVANAFNGYTDNTQAWLYCFSGADGYVHMAGSVYDNITWDQKNYITRVVPDAPPECVFVGLAVTTTDEPAVVGNTGVITMVASDEPMTVAPLYWQFDPTFWNSEVLCGFPESVGTVDGLPVVVTPTLLLSGEPLQVQCGEATMLMADWYAANGAWVNGIGIAGPNAVLSTTGFAAGLYTLRLSAGGTVVHSARVAVQ
ncbi:MAG: hypothetical protein IPG74_16205 [Flavobacteriales bacterium]|nr:hypothetical protein [Flavobacteriales bacterium]